MENELSIFNNIKEKLKFVFSDGKYIKFMVILGVCGMAMILFSEFSGDDVKNNKTASEVFQSYDTSEYTRQTEERLKRIIEQIEGAGKTEIMLTVNCTEEYVYAEEIKSDISEDGDRSSRRNENQYVFGGNTSNREALVKKVINPQISGAVILCEGGDKSIIAENIYEAVSTALDIPLNRIYVARIK